MADEEEDVVVDRLHSPVVRPRHTYLVLANLGSAFFFIFACYSGLEGLQGTLNVQSGLGTTGIGVVCACSILSSLLVAPTFVTRMVHKNALYVVWASHALYAAANFYPTWATLMPASALVGLTFPVFAVVYGVYVTTLADRWLTRARPGAAEDSAEGAPGEAGVDRGMRAKQNSVVRFNSFLQVGPLTWGVLSCRVVFKAASRLIIIVRSEVVGCSTFYLY
jgi:hypothetical protein